MSTCGDVVPTTKIKARVGVLLEPPGLTEQDGFHSHQPSKPSHPVALSPWLLCKREEFQAEDLIDFHSLCSII
jgi:hypothetical protein